MAVSGQIGDTAKRRAVKSAFAGTHVNDIATRLSVSPTTVYSWAQDPRYGGKPGGIGKVFGHERKGHRNGAANGAKSGPLPMRAKASSGSAARAPIPTIGVCPHCGGRLKLRDDA